SPWAVESFGVMPEWSHGRPRTGSTSWSVPPCADTRTGDSGVPRSAFGWRYPGPGVTRTGRPGTTEGTMLEHTSADTQAAAAAAATLHLRITIVGATVDLLRDVPFHEARPVQVAERMGISVAELEQHFPSWDGLVLAALDRW